MPLIDHLEESKPVLLILAAGVGSRYGGLKQLDGVGPNGETIMDYSIFDAIRSGFGKVVFVIKEAHLDLFESQITPKFKNRIQIGYAIQSVDTLPDDCAIPEQREKPWGTGHAILCACQEISQPFAVINADDFYGAKAFQTMADTLRDTKADADEFFLLGYRLANTLSHHGSVSRGLCGSRNGYLTDIEELTRISISGDIITYKSGDQERSLDPEAVVSMNFWGFTPKIFEMVEKGFKTFLAENINSPEAEYFITQPVDDAIKTNQARVRVLTTDEKWLGITYLEDKAAVMQGIKSRIDRGLYPPDLAADSS